MSNLEVFSPKEREQALARMEQLSSEFYACAIRIGVHPFIEFTG